ncbi:sulfatase-like hydrolase/transferase [Variovorax robiniae]|uniref:Sulfatase-like hydrolase/transferase n=1 Tax=Variovorax robiniae TaxID=1836199 RepID=A0ABU8X306_9BURK
MPPSAWKVMEQHSDPGKARGTSAPVLDARHRAVRRIDLAWAAILLVPALWIYGGSRAWDSRAAWLVVASAAFFGLLRALVGLRAFLALTYVPALFGVLAVAAERLRDVNLLEAALIRPNPAEAWPVIQPYVLWIALAAILFATPIWVAFRRPSIRMARRRGAWATLAAITVAAMMVGAVFHETVLRAWPLNVISVAAASALGRDNFLSTVSPYAATNPRSASASWGATRGAGVHPQHETYILIIGETMRADRLGACGGPGQVGLSHRDAIIYCDVMSGSSSTHTSVPLLVSRDMPGGAYRVSKDATFMKAFEEVGFRTWWLALQERGIAWPDANTDVFLPPKRTDRETLLPSLRSVLALGAPRKLIVLHAYGAHFSYCDRYDAANAPFPADCSKLSGFPDPSTLPDFRRAFDNATAESLRFVDAVISDVAQAGGSAFVMFTPDHGENLLDDKRKLFQHALKDPTPWDTRVPAVIWASDEWRAGNAARWDKLRANHAAKAMHADVVPTLLHAAAIRYVDERPAVVDLGATSPPADRTRWVMRRIGEKVDGDQLRQVQAGKQPARAGE